MSVKYEIGLNLDLILAEEEFLGPLIENDFCDPAVRTDLETKFNKHVEKTGGDVAEAKEGFVKDVTMYLREYLYKLYESGSDSDKRSVARVYRGSLFYLACGIVWELFTFQAEKEEVKA